MPESSHRRSACRASRVEIRGARAQAVQMQRGAFGRRDHEGGGAGARGLRNLDLARAAPNAWRCASTASMASGDAPRLKYPPAIAIRRPSMPRSSDGSAGSAGRSAQTGSSGSDPAWRRRRAPGLAPIAPADRGDRGWRRKGRCAHAKAGHRSASARTARRKRTARGSSRWCPSRARSARARLRPRHPSRPKSRPSCARCHAGCARARHGCSRR